MCLPSELVVTGNKSFRFFLLQLAQNTDNSGICSAHLKNQYRSVLKQFSLYNIMVCKLYMCYLCSPRHVFHKACVDPWLNEHCTCPMCKLNILKALGIVVSWTLKSFSSFYTCDPENEE